MAPREPFPAPGQNPWGEGLREWADDIEAGILTPDETSPGVFRIGAPDD